MHRLVPWSTEEGKTTESSNIPTGAVSGVPFSLSELETRSAPLGPLTRLVYATARSLAVPFYLFAASNVSCIYGPSTLYNGSRGSSRKSVLKFWLHDILILLSSRAL